MAWILGNLLKHPYPECFGHLGDRIPHGIPLQILQSPQYKLPIDSIDAVLHVLASWPMKFTLWVHQILLVGGFNPFEEY